MHYTPSLRVPIFNKESAWKSMNAVKPVPEDERDRFWESGVPARNAETSETDGPTSTGLTKTDGPTSTGLTKTDEPTSTGLTEMDGPTSTGLNETDGPTSTGLTKTDGPTSTGLTKTDGPASTGLTETDGPASTGLTETDGPASTGLIETDGPASTGLIETDGPTSTGLTETDGLTSTGLTETDGPAFTGLNETDGPASTGLIETDGPASTGLIETDGPTSNGLTETDGPASTGLIETDADIGNEFVRKYYSTLYNASEHVWRLFAEHAQYCAVHADGRRTVVTGRPQLQQLFRTSATANRDRGSRGQPIIESANTIRCGASGKLLVMATSERFVQSFVVEFSAPRSFAVVASVVQYACVARPPAPAAEDHHCVAQTALQTADGHSQQSSSEEHQLFVGCLTRATTDKDIWRKFSEYGEVVSVRVIAGDHIRSGRRLANYAFVDFSGPEGVEAALAAGPIVLYNGNRVRVNVKPYEGQT